MSASTPSAASVLRPSTNDARMKRVVAPTSAASSAKRSAAAGSRSIAMSVPVAPMRLGEQAGVAARAERAVDHDLTGLRVEQLDRLAGEHRHVRNRHLKQCGQGVR